MKNNAWKLVKKPEGVKVIDNKWVFKLKCDENGKVTKYKARLVARGFRQEKGLDYEETSKDPLDHKRLKHVDIKYHFIREEIRRNVIKPVYIASKNQIADILTKSLSLQPYMYLRNKLLN
ncbi:Reverse transcriptase (RNA-dependent DNA polymerase) [Popillia japonica]|uniref:Reverse transcriptase (RNA-dependent DNA polymerase) n=1 Tax=Popillia japonica TaxID=7064 RepID=A0AAW1JUE1_POPJA